MTEHSPSFWLPADVAPNEVTTIEVPCRSSAVDRDRRPSTCHRSTIWRPTDQWSCIPVGNNSRHRCRPYHIADDRIYLSTDNDSMAIEDRRNLFARCRSSSIFVCVSNMYPLEDRILSCRSLARSSSHSLALILQPKFSEVRYFPLLSIKPKNHWSFSVTDSFTWDPLWWGWCPTPFWLAVIFFRNDGWRWWTVDGMREGGNLTGGLGLNEQWNVVIRCGALKSKETWEPSAWFVRDLINGKSYLLNRNVSSSSSLCKWILRSEERRVGKECWTWCRSRWSPYH